VTYNRIRSSSPLKAANLVKSTSRAILSGISLLICLTFLSGCGTQGTAEPSSSQTSSKWNKSLNETDLFELRVPLNEVTSWGLIGAMEDEFFIKSYSDPNREYESFEVTSVVPDYCLPVATLILDSKESGAKYYSYYGATTDVFNYFAIGIRVYSSPELARSEFNDMYSKRDKCSSWIPKFSSGETDSEWNLGVESPSSTPDAVYWEYSKLEQAWSIGIVGATIYDLSVAIEGDLPKAINIREQAKAYFDAALKGKQL